MSDAGHTMGRPAEVPGTHARRARCHFACYGPALGDATKRDAMPFYGRSGGTDMRDWTNEEIGRYLGSEHGCYLSHARVEDVRDGAASGGTTSQIAIDLLRNDLVDGVLVWTMACGHPDPIAQPVIATTADEVLRARGSKYTSVNYPRQAMPVIKAFSGRLAVVALPCDASYLRRKMAVDRVLADKIACVITLFCGHNSEPELTKIIVRRHGAQWEDVESFRYRTGRWRGRLSFRTTDGREVDIPTRTFTHYQNLHLFSERKCLSCIDHFGYDGDISTGDIWSIDAKKDQIKKTLVVLKTQRGKALFDQVTDRLVLDEVHPRTVVNGNSRGMTYHYNISARALAGRMFGVKIKDPLGLPVTLLDRLVATVALFNFWWSHHPKYRHLIGKLPFWAIQGYIYAFKALQQINLFLYRPFPPVAKVSLIGATLSGNRGAEAMLVTTIGRIRERFPDARFVIHSYFPQRDRELCRDQDVDVVSATPAALVSQYFVFGTLERMASLVGLRWPRGWMPRGPRELADSAALVDLFGVSYADGREKFLPFNLLSNWPAMMMRVPVVKLSQGLGKFEGRTVRTIGKWMLRKCAKVFARGERSLEMTDAIGIHDGLDLAADTAFSFRARYSLSEENPQYADAVVARLQELGDKGYRRLVMSVSAVVHLKCQKRGIDYPATIARVCRHFIEQGFAVVLYPNATREGLETLHNNDLPVIAAIDQAMGPTDDRFVAIDRDLNTASLRRVMEHADLLVASRFHAMISGLSLGVPTMVLGWGHKYREVLDQFGIAQWAYDYADLDADGFIAEIERFIAHGKEIGASIAEHLPAVSASSARQFEWLAEFLRPQANICTDDEPTP